MIITVASYKGGVGKTTTAVHLAAYLQTLAPTLLLDGDDTRNATSWNDRGKGFPFKIADEVQAARLARHYEHVVIDTGQHPHQADLKSLSEGCDLLVVLAVPASLDTDGLVLTLEALHRIGADRYKILLKKSRRRRSRKDRSCGQRSSHRICRCLRPTSRVSRPSRKPRRRD